LVLVARGSR